MNLYGMVGNDCISQVDKLGLLKIAFRGAGRIDPGGQWGVFTQHVFNSLQWRGALKLIMDTYDENSDGRINKTECFVVRVVGYSWGGTSAVELRKRLSRKVDADAKKGVKVIVGLLDPVGTGRVGGRALDPDIGEGRLNLYQRNGCYRGCPGPNGWFRGRSVQGMKNRELTNVAHGQIGYKDNQLNYDHITIQERAGEIVRSVK